MRWTVVVAIKGLPDAKSRLLPASRDLDAHRALVEAIRTDTIEAARTARNVARVVVVADRPDSAEDLSDAGLVVIVQSSPGLNGALRDGARFAAQHWPQDAIAALVGDLPALVPDALAAALDDAALLERAYVPDTAGTGTTMLTVTPGRQLAPAFGTDSAIRHGADALALPAGASLRADVDTAADLGAALRLGVGPATAGVLGRSSAQGIVSS